MMNRNGTLKRTSRRSFLKLMGASALVATTAKAGISDKTQKTRPPNVILVMTDDQGYGDIAAHGHPYLKTPHMDKLCKMSVSLDQFHVDPTCAPTRAGLMTGRYSGRVGVWHTIMGRNLLREDETTMAQVFQRAGYRTAMYGKWHLGDSYPYGPQFRGFDETTVHYGGGVGQTPDYWDNDYFDDHYKKDGSWMPFQGYCTDVWFGEAIQFIRKNRDNPFFLYLPTNAAHQTRPHVAERYRAMYDDTDAPERLKIFWGMITNIDDNLGVLLDRLERWGLMDNTIIVFMGDNGTTMNERSWPEAQRPAWSDRFNAGMRGAKSSHYEGGHRVFCSVYCPAAGIEGGRKVEHLTAHIDLMPTLLELCGIDTPQGVALDGQSLVPLLIGKDDQWPQRTLFVHNQRVLDPIKWRNTAVMTDRWRLIDDKELYDIHTDPGQKNNVFDAYPEVAARLRKEYDQWWDGIRGRFHETTPLYIGAKQQNPVQLNAHDWMTAEQQDIPWNQTHVRTRPKTNGPWQVRAVRSGRYAFVLRERPQAAAFPLTAVEARLRVGNQIDERKPVQPQATGVRFEVELTAGDTEIKTWLIDSDQTARGAYYVEVHYLQDNRIK